MKKLVSIICIITLLVVSVFPVSAVDDGNEKTITGIEISIKRMKAELSKKTKKDLAKEILRDLGMTESLIGGVNEEYLDMIYGAKSISVNNQYGKVNDKGEITLLSHEEAKREMAERGIKSYGNLTRTLEDETWDERPDSLFNKSIYVIEAGNSPKGTVGLFCGFEWIDEPFYRCWDVIAISGTHLEFDEESTSVSVAYVEQIEDLYLSETTITNKWETFEFSDLEYDENILYASDFVGTKFDVPMDVYTPTMLWMCNNIGVLLMVSAEITQPQEETNFTVTGWYFHQKAGIEWDVSLSKDAATLNISPKLFYDDPHQIQVSPKYIP